MLRCLRGTRLPMQLGKGCLLDRGDGGGGVDEEALPVDVAEGGQHDAVQVKALVQIPA